MSDYLGNLVANALNLGQSIEPRLTSRYESTVATRSFANRQSTVDVLATPALDDGLTETVEETFAPAPLIPPSTRAPSPSHPPAPRPAQDARGAPSPLSRVNQRRAFVDEVSQPPAPLRPPHNEPPALESHTRPSAASNPASPGQPMRRHAAEPSDPQPRERQPASPLSQLPRPEDLPFSPPSESHTTPTAPLAQKAAAEGRSAPQEREQTADLPQPTSAPVRVTERIIETERMTRSQEGNKGEYQATPEARRTAPPPAFESVVEQSHAPVRIIAQPQITLAPPAQQEAAATRARQQEAAAPMPTIHVSIGRIEVRASLTPNQPSARKAATAGVPTLEEYLRARSGGRR